LGRSATAKKKKKKKYIKHYLEGQRFVTNADVKEAVNFWLQNGKLHLLPRQSYLGAMMVKLLR
jgi:hypothetical protein